MFSCLFVDRHWTNCKGNLPWWWGDLETCTLCLFNRDHPYHFAMRHIGLQTVLGCGFALILREDKDQEHTESKCRQYDLKNYVFFIHGFSSYRKVSKDATL